MFLLILTGFTVPIKDLLENQSTLAHVIMFMILYLLNCCNKITTMVA